MQVYPDAATVRYPKRWTTNAIAPLERHDVYFIDTTEGNAPSASMLTKTSRSYLLAHGTPGSGKTTRLLHLGAQLQSKGYACAVISLHEGIPFELEAEFWTALGRVIQRHLRCRAEDDVDQIHDAQSFIAFFYREPWTTRKVVLMVDQFHLLNQATDLVKGQFLGTLRSMRDSQASHGLHAFIGVGTYSVLDLQDHPSSPFSACHAFALPRFEMSQVRQLFEQYSRESKVELEPEIADAIYDLTSGHPGHVCFCAKMIAEHLAKGTRKLAYDSWVCYAAQHLMPRLGASGATAGLAENLLSDKPEHRKARRYLTDNFLLQDPTLPYDHPIMFAAGSEEDIGMCQFLAAVGAVREVSPNQFVLYSSLVRDLAMWASAQGQSLDSD